MNEVYTEELFFLTVSNQSKEDRLDLAELAIELTEQSPHLKRDRLFRRVFRELSSEIEEVKRKLLSQKIAYLIKSTI